jgi:hypothetical protein
VHQENNTCENNSTYSNSHGFLTACKTFKNPKKIQITYVSENPTVQKATRISDERKRGTEKKLKSRRNGNGTEKCDEYCMYTKP